MQHAESIPGHHPKLRLLLLHCCQGTAVPRGPPVCATTCDKLLLYDVSLSEHAAFACRLEDSVNRQKKLPYQAGWKPRNNTFVDSSRHVNMPAVSHCPTLPLCPLSVRPGWLVTRVTLHCSPHIDHREPMKSPNTAGLCGQQLLAPVLDTLFATIR